MKMLNGAVLTAAMLALLAPAAKVQQQGQPPPEPAMLAVTYLEVTCRSRRG